MATAKWATPSTQGTNIAGTTLDSLANGSTSAFITYDNSTNLDLYAFISIGLGSLTPSTGGSITVRAYPTAGAGADVPDDIGSVGGGESYTVPLTTSTGAKKAVIRIPLMPCSMRLQITNNAGVALAASSNSLKVQAFGESIA